MATLGERIFTFKADFRQATAGADGFIKTLGKVALGITAIGVAWLGVTKIMQTQAWARFAQAASVAFTAVIKSMQQFLHHIGLLEFGLLALAGPLGKFVVAMTEVSAVTGAAGLALQAMGVPLANLLVVFSQVTAGIAAGTTAALFALGKLAEVIGQKLANAASRWLEVGLEFEKQQFGLERAVRAFTAATGDSSVSAEDLVNKIRSISAETGIAAAEIKQGVNVMFEMSRVTKLTGAQMDELIKAMADFATVRGVAFTEVVYAVDQSFRGWHQSASALGLTLDNNAVQAEAAQGGFDKLGTVTGQATDVTNRFRAALHQMQALGLNAASESANKFAFGALRKLRGEIELINGIIGQGIAKFWQPFIKVLADLAQVVRETLGESLLGLIGVLVQLGAIVLQSIGFLVKWGSILAGVVAVIGLTRIATVGLTAAMGGFNAMLVLTSRSLQRFAALLGTQLGAPILKLAVDLRALSMSGMGVSQIVTLLSRQLGTVLVASFAKAAAVIAIPLALFASFVATMMILVKAFQRVEEETQAFSTAWAALTGTLRELKDEIVALAEDFGLIGGSISVVKTIIVNAFKLIVAGVLSTAAAFTELVLIVAQFRLQWLEFKESTVGLGAGEEFALDAARKRVDSLNKSLERTAELRGKLGFSIETRTLPGAGTTGAGARQREERERGREEVKGVFDSVTAYSALNDQQKKSLETRQKITQAMGNMVDQQEVERELFMAQTKDMIDLDKQLAEERARKQVAALPPGLSEIQKEAEIRKRTQEEIARAEARGLEQLRRFNIMKLTEQNSYLQKYGRILGMEKELALERVEAEVELLDRSLVNEKQVAQIRTALKAGALADLQQFNARILAEQGRMEEAFQEGLDAEINALRAQGVKEEQVMQIRTKKLKDEMDRRNAVLATSARERAAAEAGVVTAAAAATTGPTAETVDLNRQLQLKNVQIDLEQRLNQIRRDGINVEQLSADAVRKARAEEMQITLSSMEQIKNIQLQRMQLLRDANKEQIQAAEELAQKYLQLNEEVFTAQIVQVRQRSRDIEAELGDRIAAINATAATAEVKEAQITAAFEVESMKRRQLFLSEIEIRRNALVEYLNLQANLERQARDRRRGKEDLKSAQEDLEAELTGRPVSRRRQRERAIQAARRRVEDLTPSEFEKRAETIEDQRQRARLRDVRAVAFGFEEPKAPGLEQAARLRDQNQELVGQTSNQMRALNESMEVLRVRAVDALAQSMIGLNMILQSMTQEAPLTGAGGGFPTVAEMGGTFGPAGDDQAARAAKIAALTKEMGGRFGPAGAEDRQATIAGILKETGGRFGAAATVSEQVVPGATRGAAPGAAVPGAVVPTITPAPPTGAAIATPVDPATRLQELEAQVQRNLTNLGAGQVQKVETTIPTGAPAAPATPVTPAKAGISFDQMPQQMAAAMTQLQAIFGSGVDAMVAVFKDKTSTIPQSILEIVKSGLPAELATERTRSRGDR